ncbi:MAG: hypothetical protein IJV05_08785 [Muribaculaceae bacterium]|nr:hypothetical protein [Muribaculaceae bacterium]
MNNKLSIIFLLLALCLLLGSCQEDEPDQPAKPAKRTVLVYMVASNSLGTNTRDELDLHEMDDAVVREGLNGCRWLVYRVGPDGDAPVLFEIKADKRGNAVHETLETYDTTRHASVTVARMREVMDDVKRLAPARDYGLVLWSHATGWAPTLTTRKAAQRRVFGEDNGATMSLDELARAIPEGMFSWIYADACYMGAIEVVYQLRHCCRYFVGYPTEIHGRGMPYEMTLPLLCADQADLIGACRETYEYYEIQTGSYRTFAGAVVDCSHLDELANVCSHILQTSTPVPLDGMQCYNLNGYRFFFDFMQYYMSLADAADAERLQRLYDQTVLYRVATPMIFNRLLIDMDHFSGLSTYVLNTSPGINDEYYRTLDWYKAVYNTLY